MEAPASSIAKLELRLRGSQAGAWEPENDLRSLPNDLHGLPNSLHRILGRNNRFLMRGKVVLIPKLQLGNADMEAPASSIAKLELRLLVPKLELGNQKLEEKNWELKRDVVCNPVTHVLACLN